jgi:hypothetical protein
MFDIVNGDSVRDAPSDPRHAFQEGVSAARTKERHPLHASRASPVLKRPCSIASDASTE